MLLAVLAWSVPVVRSVGLVVALGTDLRPSTKHDGLRYCNDQFRWGWRLARSVSPGALTTAGNPKIPYKWDEWGGQVKCRRKWRYVGYVIIACTSTCTGVWVSRRLALCPGMEYGVQAVVAYCIRNLCVLGRHLDYGST
jgi:hypothetical protein